MRHRSRWRSLWYAVRMESRKGRAAEFVGYTHLAIALTAGAGIAWYSSLRWYAAFVLAGALFALLRASLVSMKTIGFAALLGLVFWIVLGAGGGFIAADVADARAARPFFTGLFGLAGGGLALWGYGTYVARHLAGERDSIVPSDGGARVSRPSRA